MSKNSLSWRQLKNSLGQYQTKNIIGQKFHVDLYQKIALTN